MGCGSSVPRGFSGSADPRVTNADGSATPRKTVLGMKSPAMARPSTPSSTGGSVPMRRPTFTSPGGLLRQGTMMAFTPMMSSIANRRSKRRKGVASYGWDAPKGGAAEGGLETIDMPSDLADDGQLQWLFERLSDPAYSHMVMTHLARTWRNERARARSATASPPPPPPMRVKPRSGLANPRVSDRVPSAHAPSAHVPSATT